MIRKPILHALFGSVSAVCIALIVTSALDRRAAVATNTALAQPNIATQADVSGAALLARGVALAAKGDDQAAQKDFQMAMQENTPAQQQLARFNLGNLQLRQAMKLDNRHPQFMPLVEQAKQQYREVLAADPQHWDARYNLERALWLSPEVEASARQKEKSAATDRVVTAAKIEAGDLP